MTPQTFGAGSATAPVDVCKTPPFSEPIPYPNIAMNATAVPSQYRIMINGQPTLNLASSNPTSSGDEAGAYGGVVSSIIKGPCMANMGSMSYMVGGTPAVRTLDPTTQNMANSMGAYMVPSQVLLTVMR